MATSAAAQRGERRRGHHALERGAGDTARQPFFALAGRGREGGALCRGNGIERPYRAFGDRIRHPALPPDVAPADGVRQALGSAAISFPCRLADRLTPGYGAESEWLG